MSNIASKACPICGSQNPSDIGIPFYAYFKCDCCSHVFALFNEKGSQTYASRFWKKEKTETDGHPLIPLAQEILLSGKNILSIKSPLEKITTFHRKYDTIVFQNYIEFCYCPYYEVINALKTLDNNGTLLLQIRTHNNPKETFLGRTHEFCENSVQIFANECDSTSQTLHEDKVSLIRIRRQATLVGKS